MTTSLITGANKGLGRETARRLIEAGHTTWIAARDPDRGRAAAEDLGGRFVQLDVTDADSAAAAVATVEAAGGGLDVLVNNAGISGSYNPGSEVAVEEMEDIYATNVFGVFRVTQAFLPLLQRSSAPVLVNVSSAMGSFAMIADPDRQESGWIAPPYASSKAAVNMLSAMYAKAFPAFRVNAVDPGYTATDLNRHRGSKTVEQGAEAIVRAACFGPDDPSGAFLDENGPLPW